MSTLIQRIANAQRVMTLIDLDDIAINGGTQPRAALNEETIAEYAEALKDGADFPHVVIFYDGKDHWLADGFHRYHAHRRAERTEIDCAIMQGTRRDAVLYSVSANSDHGLRRTNEDKRRAVLMLLADEEWNQWSDREIARRAKVSNRFVSNLRSETVTVNGTQSERTYTTKHGAQATMNTAPISAANAERANRRTEQQPTWDRVYEWLANYKDASGLTWRDLSDNQVYHANSPCFQAFIKEFPSLEHHKQNLTGALNRLRVDAQTTQRIKDAERLYVRTDQPQQRTVEQTAPALHVVEPSPQAGRLSATLDAVMTSLDSDDLRSQANAIGVRLGYENVLDALKYLRKTVAAKLTHKEDTNK